MFSKRLGGLTHYCPYVCFNSTFASLSISMARLLQIHVHHVFFNADDEDDGDEDEMNDDIDNDDEYDGNGNEVDNDEII